MSSNDRQRIVRVPGARRVRLTPAPGTDAEPLAADTEPDEPGHVAGPPAAASRTGGPNDERMLRDVPPHY